MKEFTVVGKSIPRRDALDKVLGTATYTTDVKLPGMLYAKVLRSPHAHAKVIKIDTSKAKALPGVKAVLCHLDIPKNLFCSSAAAYVTTPPVKGVVDQYIFESTARFIGDEIAAVAATSLAIAEKALALIEVEYEVLPAVFDPFEAMKPESPTLHTEPEKKEGFPEYPENNIVGNKIPPVIGMGDLEVGFKEADYIFENTYIVDAVKQAQLETHGAVADINSEGKLTIYSPSQSLHPTKRIVAEALGLPLSQVRVLNPPYSGGGFGGRIGCSAKSEVITAALAQKARRPVKLILSRQEDFIASDTRHETFATLKTGVKKDGTLTARFIKVIMNGGAYASWSQDAPGVLASTAMPVYRCPNSMFEGWTVYTNRTSAGAMRGFGNPQGMFCVESQMDEIAHALNMDPLEFRLKNISRPGDAVPVPFPLVTTGLRDCITQGAEKIGWSRRVEPDRQKSTKLRGMGMGVGSHVSCSHPFHVDYSTCQLILQQDGSILYSTGVPDIGTGTSTTLPQFVAEVLGVDISMVKIVFGDTQSTPFEVGSHASRTCYAAGKAAIAGAEKIKKEILEYAADYLKLPEDDLDIAKGMVYSLSNDNVKVSLGEIALQAHLKTKQFSCIGTVPPTNALPWEAHFAEVEVDTETGQVEIIQLVAAHDVGKAINPAIVEGQIEGALSMGIGFALTEQYQIDENGRQLYDTYHKYMMPTVMDMPPMETIIVEEHEPSGPFGVRGVGEAGLVPTAPAITNAIFNATGVRVNQIPVTPDRLLTALKNQKGISTVREDEEIYAE
ncbi:MAG: carbon monoxide dehydrogenase [Desulfosporosinus sp. BRH_c37]|nr:MAG: carbon monoxide dehydrogenase [Desulfosporosinus sp. BRH_c37]